MFVINIYQTVIVNEISMQSQWKVDSRCKAHSQKHILMTFNYTSDIHRWNRYIYHCKLSSEGIIARTICLPFIKICISTVFLCLFLTACTKLASYLQHIQMLLTVQQVQHTHFIMRFLPRTEEGLRVIHNNKIAQSSCEAAEFKQFHRSPGSIIHWTTRGNRNSTEVVTGSISGRYFSEHCSSCCSCSASSLSIAVAEWRTEWQAMRRRMLLLNEVAPFIVKSWKAAPLDRGS